MYKAVFQTLLMGWLMVAAIGASAQDVDFPERPQPPRIVNDFAEVLPADKQNQLEKKLVRFNRETSTQIAVVTLNDLRGFEISDYAVRLAHHWGVGQEDKDNGILILVSPDNGDVFVATGYGLEGAVPDATAKMIVDQEMVPHFSKGNFYKGLEAGTSVLFDLTRGEYTAQQYAQKSGNGKEGAQAPYPIGIVFLLVIIFAVVGRVRRARHYSMGHGIPFLAALTMLGAASHRQQGSFGHFSSGSGGFGGDMGGGGFGGFGGGGFGGGGAGGDF